MLCLGKRRRGGAMLRLFLFHRLYLRSSAVISSFMHLRSSLFISPIIGL